VAAKPDKTVRGYTVCTETWHAPASWLADDGEVDRLMVGRYSTDGKGCDAEFRVSWFQFDPDQPALLRLQLFEGAFQELVWRMNDLMEALALVDGRRISRPEFTALLDKLGFTDLTAREPEEHHREHAARIREKYDTAPGAAHAGS
jgi:hypothetical protein